MTQILRVEHHDLVLSFVESQIEHYDSFHIKAEKYAVDEGTATRNKHYIYHVEGTEPAMVSLSGTSHMTVLGSKQKTQAIRDLLVDRSTDLAFTSFCSRVSLAIQSLSREPENTVAVNDSHQVRPFISLISCFVTQSAPGYRVSAYQGEIRVDG